MKRKVAGDGSQELSTILTKFVEISEECETKRQLLESELEEKCREQERKHEERMMMMMMMGFMTRMVGSTSQLNYSTSLYPIPANSHALRVSFTHLRLVSA